MLLTASDSRCSRLNPRNLASVRKRFAELDTQLDPIMFAIGYPPPVFTAKCLQCTYQLALVVDAGPPTEVIVLGARARGISTAHTPDAVSFYLDQAYRARTRGAYTAAMAMYRAALEQFLQQQGFTQGRLVQRIEAALDANPPWVSHLDEDLMHALRRLGNDAVHGGDDASIRATHDRQLVHDTELLLVDVLDEVYEIPARREARRQRMLSPPRD